MVTAGFSLLEGPVGDVWRAGDWVVGSEGEDRVGRSIDWSVAGGGWRAGGVLCTAFTYKSKTGPNSPLS